MCVGSQLVWPLKLRTEEHNLIIECPMFFTFVPLGNMKFLPNTCQFAYCFILKSPRTWKFGLFELDVYFHLLRKAQYFGLFIYLFKESGNQLIMLPWTDSYVVIILHPYFRASAHCLRTGCWWYNCAYADFCNWLVCRL